jgi:hypothetical protein
MAKKTPAKKIAAKFFEVGSYARQQRADLLRIAADTLRARKEAARSPRRKSASSE